MEYRVIRSRRKTISLSISAEGEVVIRAPYGCSNAYIAAFAREKWGWVEDHMAQVQSCLEDRAAYRLQPGMTLPLLGVEMPVIASQDGQAAYRGGQWQVPPLPFEALRPQIQAIYKGIGRSYLPPVAERMAKRMGVTYGRISVNSANRRWASCSANGNLNFSWRLVMAPPEDIEYVVIHELAHRSYFDHSPDFWALVAQYCPDWQARKASLNQLHQRLLHENWV